MGLLTIAGLAACGDKVTVPGITTTPPDLTVKGVSVSPTNITLPVGSSLTVGASVDAGAGVTDRTVTWTSADASIATVGATDGKVTGVKAGVTSVTAASKADPTQKASVAVTVTPVNVNQPTVSISAINQTVCVIGGACNSVPANVQNFGTATGGTGQLDVVVNVEPNGVALKTLGGALTCGTKTLNAATQNLGAAAAATDAEANASLITLSFNTVEYDPANGTPRVFNTGPFNEKAPNTVAPCSLQVTLTPATGSALNAGSRTIELNNKDVVILTTVNENGQQASDLNGVPWKSGDIKVSVLPVLYSERGAQSATVSFPGTTVTSQT
ncbi:MAG TPA: Ig-like domain-containing protein, partial [Gemmatimonadaceae bacterium]